MPPPLLLLRLTLENALLVADRTSFGQLTEAVKRGRRMEGSRRVGEKVEALMLRRVSLIPLLYRCYQKQIYPPPPDEKETSMQGSSM